MLEKQVRICMSCIRLQKKIFHFFVGFHGRGAEFWLIVVRSVQQHATRHTQDSEPVAVCNVHRTLFVRMHQARKIVPSSTFADKS